jgi:hypothetical protein
MEVAMRLAILDARERVVNIIVAPSDWPVTDGFTSRPAREGDAIAPPTVVLEDYQAAVEAHVEATAQTRGYSSAVSCASYTNSTVLPWANQAVAFSAWRDQVWLEVYETLAAVQGGAVPPSVAGLLVSLPAMQWPA